MNKVGVSRGDERWAGWRRGFVGLSVVVEEGED